LDTGQPPPGHTWTKLGFSKHDTICLVETSPFAGGASPSFIFAFLAIYSQAMYVSYSPTFCNLRMRNFEWTRAAILRMTREECFELARKIYNKLFRPTSSSYNYLFDKKK
jgi:hypothetical protein